MLQMDSQSSDGWVELMVNLSGNDNPGLVIQVPFLVFLLTLTLPFCLPLVDHSLLFKHMLWLYIFSKNHLVLRKSKQ